MSIEMKVVEYYFGFKFTIQEAIDVFSYVLKPVFDFCYYSRRAYSLMLIPCSVTIFIRLNQNRIDNTVQKQNLVGIL